jgi:sulfite reductase (NADPH) flavoprotein alpha-component
MTKKQPCFSRKSFHDEEAMEISTKDHPSFDKNKPLFDRNHPFLAPLLENRLLSKPGSQKEARLFRLGIAGSGFRYEPGDALAIFPKNDPALVNQLLSKLGFSGEEVVVSQKQSKPLREALTTDCSIHYTTKKLLQLIHDQSPAHRDALGRLLNPENATALADFQSQNSLLETADTFPCTLSAQAYVDALRKLQPRLYSIASSQSVHPDAIDLIVNIVRYQRGQYLFSGAASGYLADRAPLNTPAVPIFLVPHPFKLPTDDTKDIIMVGPGVGCAPFKGFLEERSFRNATGRNWLFFGDQRRATDFIIEDLCAHYLSTGLLHRLDLAFSRDQDRKIYVQDRLIENGPTLWEWLTSGASFYVCGNADRMAKDVHSALLSIAQQNGHLTPEAAEIWLEGLKKEGRYQRDVY